MPFAAFTKMQIAASRSVKRHFARGEDGAARDRELVSAAAHLKRRRVVMLIGVQAAATRANRLAVRLRPAES